MLLEGMSPVHHVGGSQTLLLLIVVGHVLLFLSYLLSNFAVHLSQREAETILLLLIFSPVFVSFLFPRPNKLSSSVAMPHH